MLTKIATFCAIGHIIYYIIVIFDKLQFAKITYDRWKLEDHYFDNRKQV